MEKYWLRGFNITKTGSQLWVSNAGYRLTVLCDTTEMPHTDIHTENIKTVS